MSSKKPAQLGEELLKIRPRKGSAKPQSEQQAHEAEAAPAKPTPSASKSEPAAPRRRRRISDKKMQLNLKVDETSLNRFIERADREGAIFGDLFKKMLDTYDALSMDAVLRERFIDIANREGRSPEALLRELLDSHEGK